MTSCISGVLPSEGKISQGFRVVNKVLESAHRAVMARVNTNELRPALNSTDYEYCYSVAQSYLKKYRKLLNSYSTLTGIMVVDLSIEDAKSKDISFWKYVLNYIMLVIYMDAAVQSGLDAVIEKGLSEIFSTEIESEESKQRE